MTIEFKFPLRLETQTNQSPNWHVRSGKVKKQRQTMALVWNAKVGRKYPLAPPYALTLTRIGPRRVDDDNLASCFKAIRDQIAAQLCVNDGDRSKITFAYEQAHGPWGVRVKLEVAG